MEEKLKEYRRRRQREEIWNTLMLKSVLTKMSSPKETNTTEITPDACPIVPEEETSPNISRAISEDNLSIASSNFSFSSVTVSRLTLATYCLYALLWVTCFLIAIQLRFGAVYLVLSGLFGIYLNTRTTPKREGEMSAYSVFNPNCEAIDGTLKPEHFERDFNLIRHSPNV